MLVLLIMLLVITFIYLWSKHYSYDETSPLDYTFLVVVNLITLLSYIIEKEFPK